MTKKYICNHGRGKSTIADAVMSDIGQAFTKIMYGGQP